MSVDVVVQAPVAVMGTRAPEPGRTFDPPTAEELVRLYAADNDQLRRSLKELGDTASMIASVALGLAKLLVDAGLASDESMVKIPRRLHEQMVGAAIELGDDRAGNITVRITERAQDRIVTAL